MILPRAVVAPLALLIALVTATVGIYAGIGKAPAAFFGDEDIVVFAPANEEIPGRGEIETSLVAALRARDDVRLVSPEIYALTTLGGRSALARGIEFPAFLELDGARLREGRMPSEASEALVGARLARALDVSLGDTVPVAATFARLGVAVTIVGIVESQTPAADELLVSLDVGRALTNLQPDHAHVIRAVPSTNATGIARLASAYTPTYTYSDVRLSAEILLPGEPATIRANLSNWGQVPGVKVVEVIEQGEVLETRVVHVPPRATVPVEMTFALTTVGRTNITLNPIIPLEVAEPSLRFENLTAAGRVGSVLNVTVFDVEGVPAVGATLRLGTQAATTNATGNVSFHLAQAGRLHLVALRDGMPAAYAEIVVLPAAVSTPEVERPNEFLPIVTRVAVPPPPIGPNQTFDITVTVTNAGASGGNHTLALLVDKKPVGSQQITLGGGKTARATFPVGPLREGAHVAVVAGTDATAEFKVYGGANPYATWLAERFAQRDATASSLPPVPSETDRLIEELLGNVSLAVTALSVASGVLASLGALAVLSRHLHERVPAIGTLKALGASDRKVLQIVSRDAAGLGMLAAGLGLTAGVAIAHLIAASGLVRAFGHAINVDYSWFTLAFIGIVGTDFLVLACRQMTRGFLKRDADALMRGAT